MDFMNRDESYQMFREARITSQVDNSLDIVPPVVPMDPYEFLVYSNQLKSLKLKDDL